MTNPEEPLVRYYPYLLPEGKLDNSLGEIFCSTRPQIGEYLNQSGCYFQVITILQNFDSDAVEVFLKPLGDSVAFLRHLNQENPQ